MKLLRYNKEKKEYEVLQVTGSENDIKKGKVIFSSKDLKPCLIHINWREIF